MSKENGRELEKCKINQNEKILNHFLYSYTNEGNTSYLMIKSLRNISLAKFYINQLGHNIIRKETSDYPVKTVSKIPSLTDDITLNIESVLTHLDISYNNLADLELYLTEIKNKSQKVTEDSTMDETGEDFIFLNIKNLGSWDFDVFEKAVIYPDSVLTAVMYSIFKERQFGEKFDIPEKIFLNFSKNVEKMYHKENPYHNNMHGAEVVQAINTMLNIDFFNDFFTDLEIFSAIVAASIHDVDHPGLNNQFLINTNSSLALTYNDISVLENHHLSTAFHLMKDPENDIFCNFNGNDRMTARKIIIDMVLATDMKQHGEHLTNMDLLFKLNGQNLKKKIGQEGRLIILKYALHCADISNTVRPFNIYLKWTYNLMEENFNQGEKEKTYGYTVSPYCDKNNFEILNWQINFFEKIVFPLWGRWESLVNPEGDRFVKAGNENLNKITSMLKTNKNI